MYTHTQPTTGTFTQTCARYVASKIAADLRRLQGYYGKPSDEWVERFRQELCELLAGGYVSTMEYGFERQGRRVLCLRYTFRFDGTLADDHAGGVPSGVDIGGANWFSYLTRSEAWWRLSPEQREHITAALPVRRVAAAGPQDGDGYWHDDRSYAQDGDGARRGVFRPYQKI
jgi:hypothetical protein